jgi:FkbM family methyltransferase
MVGQAGKVVAFEPEAANFKLLRKNVAVNGMIQVQLVSLAVLQNPGRILLFLSPRNAGDHRVWDNAGYHHVWDTNVPRQTTEVYATSLDRYFGLDRGALPPAIRLIKLDIQGSEVLALRGAQRLLDAQESLALFLELWPVGLDCAGKCEDGVEQLQHLLQTHQFRCWHIDDKQKKLVAVTELGRLVDKAGGYFTNLLCIKGNIELPSFGG